VLIPTVYQAAQKTPWYYSSHMETDTIAQLREQITAQSEAITRIYTSVEKTRKYFLWTLIITVVLFVLPLVGLVFIIPSFLSTYTETLSGLGI